MAQRRAKKTSGKKLKQEASGRSKRVARPAAEKEELFEFIPGGDEYPHRGERFISMEIFRELREAFNSLQAAPEYERLARLQVGAFWDTKFVRDPFLEELNWRQLLSIKLEHLIEKKSFTAQKGSALVAAAQRCLASAGALGPLPEKGEAAQDPAPREVPWRAGAGGLNPVGHALAALFESQWAQIRSTGGCLPRLMVQLPPEVTREQFAVLWLGVDQALGTVASLLGLSQAAAEELHRLGKTRIAEMLVREKPVIVELWRAALSGTVVAEVKLIEPCLKEGLDVVFQRQFCRMILTVMGAESPRAAGQACGGFWTTNKPALELLLRSCKGGTPLLSSELQVLLPDLDADQIKRLLETFKI